MKLSSIENLYSTLKDFQEREMPIKLSYKFSKLFSAAESDYQFFYTQLRKILEKYAEKDENGNIIQNGENVPIKKDSLPLAEKALEDLCETEISLPKITFTLDELEVLNVKPFELKVLLPFIEE
jgi:hypothetical protein